MKSLPPSQKQVKALELKKLADKFLIENAKRTLGRRIAKKTQKRIIEGRYW